MALPSVKPLNTEMLNTPNALLGLEYILAGLTYYPSLKIYTNLTHIRSSRREYYKDFLPSGTALQTYNKYGYR